MSSDIQTVAERQWCDYRAREPGTCFLDPGFTLDLVQAYALQDAVAALRISAGDRLIGYKVGCTGPGVLQQFGMEGPIRGCLFEIAVREHRSNGGFVLPHGDWLLSKDYLERRRELSVRINDRLVTSGGLWPMPGGMLASLGWLREHLAKTGRALLSGQIILTGTALGLYAVRPGDHIAVRVDDVIGSECTSA